MRLLVLTQAVDLDHPVLGFSHGWIEALARRVEQVTVLAVLAGRHQLADNVRLLACAAVLVTGDRDAERRVVLACAMPAAELMTSARVVRTQLLIHARTIAEMLDNGELPGPVAL